MPELEASSQEVKQGVQEARQKEKRSPRAQQSYLSNLALRGKSQLRRLHESCENAEGYEPRRDKL